MRDTLEEYDYIIVNIDVEESVARAEAILTAERQKRERLIGLRDFISAISGEEQNG